MSYRSFAYEKFPNPLSKQIRHQENKIKVGDFCKYFSESDDCDMYVRVRRVIYNEFIDDFEIWGVYTTNEDGYFPYNPDFDETEGWMPESELEIVKEY